jgi:cytochrome P450
VPRHRRYPSRSGPDELFAVRPPGLENGPFLPSSPIGSNAASPSSIFGPEANRFVFLTGREHFSHDLGWTPVVGETLGHGLLNMDPPEHTRHRALMNPAFTTTFMAAYLPLMQRVIAERTADWVDSDDIDLMTEAREITFDAPGGTVGFRTGPQVDGCANALSVTARRPGPRQNRWRSWPASHRPR